LIDLELCPNCGGQLKIISAIFEALVIERVTHQERLACTSNGSFRTTNRQDRRAPLGSVPDS